MCFICAFDMLVIIWNTSILIIGLAEPGKDLILAYDSESLSCPERFLWIHLNGDVLPSLMAITLIP